jgi:osmotically-inducible protein OsmY
VRGVKGVSNFTGIKPLVVPQDVKRKIEETFERSAEIEASRIAVEANGGEMIPSGTVRSWAQREEAERVTWRAPGAVKVENRIAVSQ